MVQGLVQGGSLVRKAALLLLGERCVATCARIFAKLSLANRSNQGEDGEKLSGMLLVIGPTSRQLTQGKTPRLASFLCGTLARQSNGGGVATLLLSVFRLCLQLPSSATSSQLG